jgi:chemotaxis protein MotB
MSAKDRKDGRGSIVIKKEEVVEGGHHGGAWKVAYADFVTAMMAFFLLMWLINATTEEQRRGLADYFTPNNSMSAGHSGNGRPFGGRTPFEAGTMVSDRGAQAIRPGKNSAEATPMDDPDSEQAQDDVDEVDPDGNRKQPASGAGGKSVSPRPESGPKAVGGGQAAAQAQTPNNGQSLANTANSPTTARVLDEAAFRAERARREREGFDRAAAQIREAVRNDPALSELARQLSIDHTPEGLRIQILDEERTPMFATGSSAPNDRAKLVLHKIAPILARLPEDIAVSGHTDAAPFKGDGRSNWELSADRANATRRALAEGGLPEGRIKRVAGMADKDPLLPADPFAAANRRIAILVLRAESLPVKQAAP